MRFLLTLIPLLFLFFGVKGQYIQSAQVLTSDYYNEAICLVKGANGGYFSAGNYVNQLGPTNEIPFQITANSAYQVYIMAINEDGQARWLKSLGGNFSDRTSALKPTPDGGFVVAGNFNDTVDMDPGPDIRRVVSKGSSDGFVSKFDQDGNLIWNTNFGGKDYDEVVFVDVTNTGDVYVSLTYYDSLQTPQLPSPAISKGGTDCMVAKLDYQGKVVWFKSFGTTGLDDYCSISVDKENDVLVTGSYRGNMTLTDQDTTITLFGYGGPDIFLIKIGNAGIYKWANGVGSGSFDFGRRVITDSDMNVYSVGIFSETVNFNPGGFAAIRKSNGEMDWFIRKMDKNGKLIWVKNYGGNKGDGAIYLTMAGDTAIYACSYYTSDSVSMDATGQNILRSRGNADAVVQKLDTTGNLLWYLTVSSKGEDLLYRAFVDQNERIFFAGSIGDTAHAKLGSDSLKLVKGAGIRNGLHLTVNENGFNSLSNISVEELTVFPNPASGFLQIEMSVQEKPIIEIKDIQGRSVATSCLIDFNKLLINTSELNPGWYHGKVQTKSDVRTFKFLKTNE